MSNMFKDMFNERITESTDSVERLVLVETIVGLTDYVHPPALRAPEPNVATTILDEIVLENRSGGVSPTQLKNYSAHLSGLSVMPNGISTIRGQGGFSEYMKGMMKLKFRLQTGGIEERYMSVIGYVTDNDLDYELSDNATFTPVFSWKHRKVHTGGLGVDYLTPAPVETIGLRTDYMLNDGSYSDQAGLATVRPGDIMGNAGDTIAHADCEAQAEMEGIEIAPTLTVSSAGAINQTGIICSNRRNYNPTRYAEDLLGSAMNAQTKLMFSHADTAMDEDMGTDMFSSELGIVSDMSSELLMREPRPAHDDFLSYMKDLNGSTTYRGFRGWAVRDLRELFPNLDASISANGFISVKHGECEVVDFTEIARVFGTSSFVEVIAQELVFNLLELLIGSGLSEIHLVGTNCREMPTEDRLSNIEIVHSQHVPLGDDDGSLFQKGESLCEQLRNQIFNKLNGESMYHITPVEFEVQAAVMGVTHIYLRCPSEENVDGTFIYYAFPTYAPSPWSPIFSDVETAHQLSKSVYGNVKSFFLDN